MREGGREGWGGRGGRKGWEGGEGGREAREGGEEEEEGGGRVETKRMSKQGNEQRILHETQERRRVREGVGNSK